VCVGRWCLLVAIVVMGWLAPAWAVTTDVACSDSAIRSAVDSAGTNDIIRIAPGSCTITAPIILDTAGITLTAQNINNRPVLTKTSERLVEIAATGVTVSYLVLDNGNRRSSYWYGVIRIISGNSARIRNNLIRDGWMGIMIVSGHSHEIDNNTIHNFGTQNTSPENGSGFGIYNNSPGGSSYSQSIKIHDNDIYDAGGDSYQTEGSGQNYVEIYNNLMHNNGEDAIDLKNARFHRIYGNSLYNNNGDGLVTHSNLTSSDIEFYGNKVYSNGWWGVYIVSGSNWSVYNNLIYDNASDQRTYQTRGLRVTASSSTVYHNTIYNNGRAGYYGTATFRNNALFNNGAGLDGNIRSASTGTITHNYVYPASPGITGTSAITSATPGFANVSTRDFTLVAGSVLIDAGVTGLGITTDYAGTSRTTPPDIGAYEAGGSPPPPPDPDTTPPVISGITEGTITETTAVISWTTDEVSTTQIHYGTSAGVYGSSTTKASGLVTAHQQTLTGLTASTTYYYVVESTDASGNTATSSEGDLTTAAAPAAPDFPTTGTLDNFNRSNEGPPPSASWANTTGLSGSLQVTSNQAAGSSASPAAGTNAAYWNVTTFGPEAEAFVTVATKPGTNQGVAVAVRLREVGTVNVDGYRCLFVTRSGTDEFLIQRVDNGTTTTLGAVMAQELSAGQKFGCEAIGSTIALYYYNGSTWASLGSRTDSTYPAAGYIGADSTSTTARLDDFSGGTRNQEADVTAPVISGITVSSLAHTSVTLSWTTDEPADTQIDYGLTAGYGSSTTLAAALVTSHSQTITGLTSNTTYHYAVKSSDAFGNAAASDDATFLTTPAPTDFPITSVLDTFNRSNEGPPPSANWSDAIGLGEQTQVVSNTWRGELASPASGINADYWNVATYGPDSEVFATLTTKITNETQSLFIRLRQVGDTTIDGYQLAFTAKAGDDTWAIQRLDNGALTQLGDSFDQEVTNGQKFGLRATGTTLEAYYYNGTVWVLLASRTDATYGEAGYLAGGFGAQSTFMDDFGGGTMGSPDATPPVISAVAESSITTSGATITWTTDEAADSLVEYGLDTGYNSATTLNVALVTSHSEVLTGLAPATAYFYRVISCDAVANCATSSGGSFRTAALPDTTAPVITNVSLAALGTATAVITSVTDEDTIVRLEYGLTTSYGLTTPWDYPHQISHTRIIMGLAANTGYHYRVQACDTSDNCTNGSNQTFTTLAAPAVVREGVESRVATTREAAASRTQAVARVAVER
jgi:parallel beta-helix repeat protein